MTSEVDRKKVRAAPKNSERAKDAKKGAALASFVNYELTKEQSAACKESPFSADTLCEMLERLTDSDYKVTFSHDDRNGCFACWLIPTRADHVNGGMILPGRGSTAAKAFKQACFKHYHVFDGLWGDYASPRREDEIDD